MPYYGEVSFKIRKELTNLIRQYYPQLSPQFVFVNNYRIKNFFPFKDRVSDALRCSLVYKYNCCGCSSTYVGVTSRHLRTRISEHRGVSGRTGLPLTSPPFSAIREHSVNTGHNIDNNNFSILATAPNKSDLYLMESILIRIHTPSLNSGISAELKVYS